MLSPKRMRDVREATGGLGMRPGMDAYDAVSFVADGRCDRAAIVLNRRPGGGYDICIRIDGIYTDTDGGRALAKEVAKYHAQRLGLKVSQRHVSKERCRCPACIRDVLRGTSPTTGRR